MLILKVYIHKFTDILSLTLIWVAAITLLVAMVGGAADVVSMVLVGRSLPGAYEATELLLVLIIFFAQPYAMLDNAHIAIDLFNFDSKSTAGRTRHWLTRICAFVSYAALLRSAVSGFAASYEIREISQGFVSLPVYPFKLGMVIGIGAALLQVVVGAFVDTDGDKRAGVDGVA